MQARSKLKPGQKGTRKRVELYDSRLVCVRYRYDERLQKRFKIVELIVEETPWIPKTANRQVFKSEEIVGLKFAYGEELLKIKTESSVVLKEPHPFQYYRRGTVNVLLGLFARQDKLQIKGRS